MKDIEAANNLGIDPISCGVLPVWMRDKYKIGDNAANDANVILRGIHTVQKKTTLNTTPIPTFIKFIRTEFISFRHALKAANNHHNTFQRAIEEGYDPYLFDTDDDRHE